MEILESMEYLDELKKGDFCTVNIPLINNEKIPVTAMFLGKNEDGNYSFVDTGKFVLSKHSIERANITLDRDFNKREAQEIHSNIMILRKAENRKKKLSR